MKKTLAKIVKIEDGYVHYEEISRSNGEVMIEDYMTITRFKKALESEEFGFELVNEMPKVSIKTLTIPETGRTEKILSVNGYAIVYALFDEDNLDNGFVVKSFAGSDIFKTIQSKLKNLDCAVNAAMRAIPSLWSQHRLYHGI